jgi:flagellar basal body-associated protein FliL
LKSQLNTTEANSKKKKNIIIIIIIIIITKKKGKAVPLQAWSGPEGSRNLGSQIS